MSNTENTSVARSTALMTVGTLLSRLTGLARTWVMAYVLGASYLASAYQVANNLPNIIYETIAGGMIAAAFLPVLMLVAETSGNEGANRYASNILNIAAVVLGAVSILGIVFAEPLIATQSFTVDGQKNDVVQTSIWLFRIFSVQILFYGLSGIVQGILNANRTFFITAFAPALNNIAVIVSFIAYAVLSPSSPELALGVLAAGTTAGVFVQFAVQIPAVMKQGVKWMPVLDLKDPALKETVKIALPTMVFVFASIVGQSARNAFALGATEQGPAMITYAWLWFQLPYGVIAVSLARTMFTEMSDAAAKRDIASLRSLISQGLSGTLCLMIPCAAALFACAYPLACVFQSGAFTADDTACVASLIGIWALGLPAYSVWCYLYNAFAAMRRFLPFAILNVCLTAVQVLLYWAMTSSELGIYGIPAADVVYYLLYAVGSLLLARYVVGAFAKTCQNDEKDITCEGISREGSALGFSRADLVSILKIFCISVVAGAAMLVSVSILPMPEGALSGAFEACVVGGCGLVVIIGIAHLLKVKEVSVVVSAVVSRIKRK